MTARPFPQPDAPLVDPATGRIERVWLDFLRFQFARIGGVAGAGPAQALPVVQDQAAMALLFDAPEPDLATLRYAIADAPLMALVIAD